MEIDIETIQNLFPRYKVQKLLGTGSFASVYLAIEPETQSKLAIKKINCFGMCDYQRESSINEAKMLSSLNHPHIIHLNTYRYDTIQDNLYIMMEYADQGDLGDVILDAKEKKISLGEQYIWKVLRESIEGLRYMHKNKILHRDIKPGNIFIGNKMIKIGDLNVSRILQGGLALTKIGSPHYIGPQIWTGEGYNEKCDIWSLGVVIYQLCSLQLPFQDSYIQQMVLGKSRQKNLRIPSIYSSKLENIINKMLRINPNQRISSIQILQACNQLPKNQPQEDLDLMLETGFLSPQKNPVVITPLSHKSCKEIEIMKEHSSREIRFRKIINLRIQEKTVYQQTEKENKREKSIQLSSKGYKKYNFSPLNIQSRLSYYNNAKKISPNQIPQQNIKSLKHIYHISKHKSRNLSPYKLKINFNNFIQRPLETIKKKNHQLFAEHLKKFITQY